MLRHALVSMGGLLLAASCGDPQTGSVGGSGTSGSIDPTTSEGESSDTTTERLDLGSAPPNACASGEDCELIDVLFVIDNSATMGDEQLNLSANFQLLVERLQDLRRSDGGRLNADVNIMVTTSDFGHPLCTEFHQPGYEPAQGSPVYTGCNARIAAFSSPDPWNPVQIPEACTSLCPVDIVPGGDPFIHFDAEHTNVPMADVSGALSCVAPQGINGCGYEAPLESMLQALRPEACWNAPHRSGCADDPDWGWVSNGFLRRGSTLAVAIITDEADCSVRAPEGFAWFTHADMPDYWLDNPATGSPLPSSATCWLSGTECEDADGDGIYESCVVDDANPVLHPTSRYTQFFDYLRAELDVRIVMLGVVGIPPVTDHNPRPPFEPSAGGVAELVYRQWRDGPYDGTPEGGDILPSEWVAGVTAADKHWEFGMGPGCTVVDERTGFVGQAVPPLRIRQVCESLDEIDDDGQRQVRCCLESICDDDFSAAINCLSGVIQDAIVPVQ
jgi:hypothetical protein